MKKALYLMLLMALCCMFALTACNNNNPTPEPHTHNFEEWQTLKAATCIEDGAEERYCSCGEKQTRTVSAYGHTIVVDSATEATCKVSGKTEGKHCSACGTIIVEQTVIPLAGHTYDNEEDASCNVCGYTRKLNCKHTNTMVLEAVVPTCTAGGLTEGQKCLDCDETLIGQSAIGSLGHIDVIDSAIPATCTADGKTEGKHCSRCNTTLVAQTTIGKLGHIEVVDAEVPATCTNDGKTEGKHCSRCNTTLVAQNIVEKWGHAYDDDFDKECNRCGFERTITCKHDDPTKIAKVPAVEPDCQNTGLTEGMICNLCGTMVLPQTIIETIDCIEGEWIIDKEASKTEDGKRHTECTMCKQIIQEQILGGGSQNLWFSLLDDGTYELRDIGTCKDTEIIIPSYHNGKQVTRIKVSAFQNNTKIVSVIIPSTVTSIGTHAFRGCTALTDVIMGDGVVSIEDNAFRDCSSLKNIVLSNSLNNTGENTFWGCSSLESIVIPSSVTSIGYSMFRDCTSLTNITIPSSVHTILGGAFRGCTALENISLPTSMTTIGKMVFLNCSALKTITIPASVTYIGWETFSGCEMLETIVLENPVGWQYTSYGTVYNIPESYFTDPIGTALLLIWNFSDYDLERK